MSDLLLCQSDNPMICGTIASAYDLFIGRADQSKRKKVHFFMIIGTTKELKNHEYRVGLTPDNVAAYVAAGHTVLFETGAGLGAGFEDKAYEEAGAQIKATAAEVYGAAEMIIKVKEPEECEYDLLREGSILFTYLHLAPNPSLADILIKKKIDSCVFNI